MRSPPSTLSRRKAPPSGRSLANADTGVSRSASRSRTIGTSSRVVVFDVAVSTTRLQTKTLARSRDEGSWCHPILARHCWRTLSLRGHGAPLGNGRPPGPMVVRSKLPTHSDADIRDVLAGLPAATGYRVTVKPLRYRTAPHLQAFTFWDEPEMVLQVPEPFRPFREMLDLGADGTPIVLFRTRRDVIRFLYLHEDRKSTRLNSSH